MAAWVRPGWTAALVEGSMAALVEVDDDGARYATGRASHYRRSSCYSDCAGALWNLALLAIPKKSPGQKPGRRAVRSAEAKLKYISNIFVGIVEQFVGIEVPNINIAADFYTTEKSKYIRYLLILSK